MYWLCPQASYLSSLSLSFFICKGTIMPTPRTVEGLNEIMCTWWIEFSKYGHNISHPTCSMRTLPPPHQEVVPNSVILKSGQAYNQ